MLKWQQAESDHLREVRVAKSKSLKNKRDPKISISGYEVIRVLGKGSFGVVRLVREKHNTGQDHESSRSRNQSQSVLDTPDNQVTNNAMEDYMASRTNLRRQKRALYAMKVIRKSEMLRNSQEGHLRAERDFLVASASSEWVVPLVSSFQDHANLYLVMEYMVGGDFLGLLLREDILDECVTAFYIAEMVLCIEETHRMGWIHRDVKPDNFLIDADGHLKISDFGLSFDGHWKHNQNYFSSKRYELASRLQIDVKGDAFDIAEEAAEDSGAGFTGAIQRFIDKYGFGSPYTQDVPILDRLNWKEKRKYAKSVVGTSQYMAPEIIRGDQYDGRCDWWSIGIILYECLYGRTPFFCENRAATKEKILQHRDELYFPNRARFARPWSDNILLGEVTNHAIDLITGLLQEKEHRVSSPVYMNNDLNRAARRSHTLQHGQSQLSENGHFVYKDDAGDIKAHPFFRMHNIDFATIHRKRPHFVPMVKSNQPITKYFDDEKDILSEDDRCIESLSESTNSTSENEGKGKEMEAGVAKEKKEKKRPRDKILRDDALGKKAMELRKQKAFLGYTYRKPPVCTHRRGDEDAVEDFRVGKRRNRPILEATPREG
ncbi:kinase-like protein [Rhizodiscina lignyota]|uniref:non-specific serine/threonine protein kinase n=1 Tax=Rhizodiscina lignyota TaxID=1504668 RepID=A0A9P4MC37_9PEZI|nr:kinase-like protein [Rhizodiscina lignyota]